MLTCSAILLFAAPIVTARAVAAATFTVDTEEDGVDATPGDGECATEGDRCTLRAAIQEANMAPGPDAITLPAGMYLIAREGEDENKCATGDLDITSAISINGAGAATTIVDANHRDRAFDVRMTGAAIITGVTVQNGSARDGGGVRIEGGTLRLVESTVKDNQAADTGGGIDNDFGVLELLRSTVSGNVAHNTGGGIENSGTATLRNVTLSGNAADILGGGLSNLGLATLNNTTVTANTLTGVESDGQLVFMNSLLADNAGPDCLGTLTSRGFNLIRNTDGCKFDGDTSGDLHNMDPELGPLEDNGGPTFTHALLEGSAALDAANPATPGGGDPACEEEDQRGVARPQGPRSDIGAYEACGTSGSAGGAFVNGCVSVCGDGTVDPGEECDSGTTNGKPGDPCDAECKDVPPGANPPPSCGDGHVDDDEECDDGNHKKEDGCSSMCKLEEPISCEDEEDDHDRCDPKARFKALNCILEQPVCKGESVPLGILKRIQKARVMLGIAAQSDDTHRGKRVVRKAVRTLKKAIKVHTGVVRKGALSSDCATALDEILTNAVGKCQIWRKSFCVE
jgi:CSLREA domain-containing protein